MASIPCAAYQAGSIHGELRRKHLVRLRTINIQRTTSLDSATPPSSPSKTNDAITSIFSHIFNKQRLRSHSDVSSEQTAPIAATGIQQMIKSS